MNARQPIIPSLDTARQVLLTPYGLDETDLLKTFTTLNANRVDYADLYFQRSQFESWRLEEGIVKTGQFSIEQGVGVRAISGERTAFSYSDEISAPALHAAAQTVRTIARHGQGKCKIDKITDTQPSHHLYEGLNPLDSLLAEQKVELLNRIEQMARAADPRIVQVMASLAGKFDVILVARSDGRLAADIRPLVRFSLTVVAEQNGRREVGSSGAGGRTAYGHFNEAVLQKLVKEAVAIALTNLEARPAPAGMMPVVLGSGWPGILLHEAIGHGLEGDFNRKGSSAFSGRIGERVAAPGVTVVDDGTLPGRRGSLNIDDEGNPTHNTVLIENGILRGYLQDSLNARLMKTHLTGNGRRESYASLPLPRMTNTYMYAGDRDPEEIISSVKHGLYAVNFAGGQVDITSGKFVFSASEAYMIENGKISYPVIGATLIGNGPDVLTRVSMVGNDMRLDDGVGTCGKEGQSVPVGVGQPTLLIDGLTIGGTANTLHT